MNWYSTCIPTNGCTLPRGLVPNRAYLCRWPEFWIDSAGRKVKERRIFSIDRPNNQGGWESEGFIREKKPSYRYLYPVPLSSEYRWSPAVKIPQSEGEVLVYVQRWTGVARRVPSGIYLGRYQEHLPQNKWVVCRWVETALAGVIRVPETVYERDIEWLPLPPVDQGQRDD
jgi:hypothetical protein